MAKSSNAKAKRKQNSSYKDKDKDKDKENIYRRFDHLKITVSQYNKLIGKFTEQEVNNILDEIQNYAKNKNYKDLYLTAKSWLNKRKAEIDKKKPNPFDKRAIPHF